MNSFTSYDYLSQDFEKSRNSKLRKKVSKYRDKNGQIKAQIIECKDFIEDIYKKRNEWNFICYRKVLEYFTFYKKKSIKDFKKGTYIKCRLKQIINKNKCYMTKISKEDNVILYDTNQVYEFLLILCEAAKTKKIREFLDVPDVFYIVRQLKITGIECYFDSK